MTALAAPSPEKIEAAPPAAVPASPSTALVITDMVLPEMLVLHARPHRPVSEEEYFAFCRDNDHLRVECTADGEWIIMPPTAGDTSDRNAELTMQLRIWAKRDGTGVAFDSNGGFTLPNGARRAPDASWVTRALIHPHPGRKAKVPAALPRLRGRTALPLRQPGDGSGKNGRVPRVRRAPGPAD